MHSPPLAPLCMKRPCTATGPLTPWGHDPWWLRCVFRSQAATLRASNIDSSPRNPSTPLWQRNREHLCVLVMNSYRTLKIKTMAYFFISTISEISQHIFITSPATCPETHTHVAGVVLDRHQSQNLKPSAVTLNTFRGWVPLDKFNADRHILPSESHQQIQLGSLFKPVTFLTSLDSNSTATKTQVWMDWDTGPLFQVLPTGFSNLMCWACYFCWNGTICFGNV